MSMINKKIAKRKNAPRRYARNRYGISMRKGGRINITKPLFEYLGMPTHIRFEKHNLQWMKLSPADEADDMCGVMRFTKTTRYINNVKLYNEIMRLFQIVRNDDKRMHPFYYAEYTFDSDGITPIAYIRMTDFPEYCYQDSNGNYVRRYRFIRPLIKGLPYDERFYDLDDIL